MNAVLLDLQIEVSVGKAAGAPVLLRNDFSRSRCELVAKGPAPGAVGVDLRARAGLLDRGPKFPCLVVARAPAMVRREEDPGAGVTSRLQDPDHVRYKPIRFHDLANSGPQLSAIRDEVVVRIDDQKPRLVQSKGHIGHGFSPLRGSNSGCADHPPGSGIRDPAGDSRYLVMHSPDLAQCSPCQTSGNRRLWAVREAYSLK